MRCDALFINFAHMILHNIKQEQISQLEAMFGKMTNSGLEIPEWLLRLKETATTSKAEDFEVMVPRSQALLDSSAK
jgi:hypothetical protein